MEEQRKATDCAGCRRLQAQVAALEKELARRRALVEAKEREGKRQAAPFRKKRRAAPPKKPGRKRGAEHGPHAHRTVPEHIDERHEAPLPACCPSCRGRHLQETHTEKQYQVEIVRTQVTREFTIHVGGCEGCGQAHAAIALLHKQAGLAFGKIQTFFADFFDLPIARSTACRSMQRTARRCAAA